MSGSSRFTSRRISRGHSRAQARLRLSLRRRTGGALRRPPRPDLGRAAGPLAAPLRDRARPRPGIRLRLAGRQRRPLRLRPALLAGRPGITASTPARRRARRRATRSGGRRGRRHRCRRRRPARLRARRASARRCCARRRAGTSPPPCSPRQLMAESDFDPYAVSPAGAQGIAQFMPVDRGRLRPRATPSTRSPRSTPRPT